MKGLFLGMALLSIALPGSAQIGFKAKQLTFERVKLAYKEKWADLKNELKTEGTGSDFQLYLAAYKQEGRLEVWTKGQQQKNYNLFKIYTFCRHSGILGPKVKEGDLQTPEGTYHIVAFNPESKFQLSLGINYPNAEDLLRSGKEKPGSEIYIHGDCVTVGCIPITDDKIRELYVLAVEAREHGQAEIPVQIFPFKMNAENMRTQLLKFPQHKAFWASLKLKYDAFEKTKQAP
ncbi:L,D-transpeptidase family protein [Pedobacter sp. GR22-6]|uniref:L,D-transpeptidase family protein n=1 Tax=Pedobacter sp. GR22-6 TaxID=3127957 RepID=UPI00307DAF3C